MKVAKLPTNWSHDGGENPSRGPMLVAADTSIMFEPLLHSPGLAYQFRNSTSVVTLDLFQSSHPFGRGTGKSSKVSPPYAHGDAEGLLVT